MAVGRRFAAHLCALGKDSVAPPHVSSGARGLIVSRPMVALDLSVVTVPHFGQTVQISCREGLRDLVGGDMACLCDQLAWAAHVHWLRGEAS